MEKEKRRTEKGINYKSKYIKKVMRIEKKGEKKVSEADA